MARVEGGEQPGTWVTVLTGDMGNTFLVLFSPAVAVVGPVGLWEPVRVLHKSTGLALWLAQTIAATHRSALVPFANLVWLADEVCDTHRGPRTKLFNSQV